MFNPLIRTIGILSLSVTISGCQGNKTTGTIKIASDGRVSSAGLVAKVSNGQCVQLPLLIESLKTSESQTARVYVDSLDLFAPGSDLMTIRKQPENNSQLFADLVSQRRNDFKLFLSWTTLADIATNTSLFAGVTQTGCTSVSFSAADGTKQDFTVEMPVASAVGLANSQAAPVKPNAVNGIGPNGKTPFIPRQVRQLSSRLTLRSGNSWRIYQIVSQGLMVETIEPLAVTEVCGKKVNLMARARYTIQYAPKDLSKNVIRVSSGISELLSSHLGLTEGPTKRPLRKESKDVYQKLKVPISDIYVDTYEQAIGKIANGEMVKTSCTAAKN